MSPLKFRIVRVLLLYIVPIFAVVFILHGCWTRRVEAHLAAELASVHAASELTEASSTGTPIPQDGNGAVLFEKALSVIGKPSEAEEKVFEKLARAASPPLQEEELVSLRAFVARNIEALQLLHEGASKETSAFQILYEDIDIERMKQIEPLMNTARLLMAQAIIEWDEGDAEDALVACRAAFRLSKALWAQPLAVTRVEHMAVIHTTLPAFRVFLEDDHQDLPKGRSMEIMGELAELGARQSFVRAIQGELAYAVWFYQGRLNPTAGRTARPWQWRFYRERLHRPLTLTNGTHCLRSLRRALPLARLRYYELDKKGTDLDGHLGQGTPPHCFEARMLSFRVAALIRAQAVHEAFLGGLRAAIALRLYKSQTGSYPDALEALVPEYLQELEGDPFAGALYVYKKGRSGFLVYSVGPDGEDNGGVLTFEADRTDIPWRGGSYVAEVPPTVTGELAPSLGDTADAVN